MTIPKRKRVRDEHHLSVVRRLACCSCTKPGPSHAHHIRTFGLGMKADDRLTVPLCAVCHQTWHTSGRLPGLDREASLQLMRGMQKVLVDRIDTLGA